MLKMLFILLLAIQAIDSYAQADPGKYASSITREDVKKHLEIIAGKEMEGRETATEGQKKAASYIENYFRALGLAPGSKSSYQQVFSLVEDSIAVARLKIGKNEFGNGSEFMMSARTNQTRRVKAQKVVFAGYGISDSLYNDYFNLDVKNALVVLAPGEPQRGDAYFLSGINRLSSWSSLSVKVKTAHNKGARGVLIISPYMEKIDSLSALNMRKTGTYFPGRQADQPYSLNNAHISHRLFGDLFGKVFADSMLKKIQQNGIIRQAEHKVVRKKFLFECTEVSSEKGNSSNVLAVLEGTDKKNEYVFVTAHYDHLGKKGDVIYYGADDDGSGTVAVLEMAEAFVKAKSEGFGPRRSVVFMTVSGEEKGLWGSSYYADHPVFPLKNTSVDINIDMIGRIDPKRTKGDSTNYVYVIGDNKLSSDLKIISESVNNKYTRLELDYKYNDPKDPERIYYRSDHYNFARKGVPILFYFSGTHADYHRPTDTVDKINFDLLTKRAQLIFYTAWEIANRDDMLKRDIPME